jgi:predicted phosphoribosyltransferase
VDDGLATGASMRAAVRALRQRGPSEITVAVPVGAPETCAQFRDEVDEVICGRTPEPFNAVGMWYAEFKQVSDEEVSQLLDHAAHELRARRVQTHLRHRRGCQEEEQTVRTFEDKKGQIYADADGEPR